MGLINRISIDNSNADSNSAARRRRSLSNWSWSAAAQPNSLVAGDAAEVLQSVDAIREALSADLRAVQTRAADVLTLERAMNSAEDAHTDSLWMRFKFAWKGMLIVARGDASAVLVPVILFALMLGLGVWAVLEASRTQETRYRNDAVAAAHSFTESILSGVRDSYMPAVMLANFISLYPDWSQLSGKLPGLATKLLATNGAQHTQTLEVAPFAVYAGAYPTPNVDTNPPGIDLLSEAMPPLRNGVLGLITLKTPYVQLTGPYLDRSGNNILLPVGLHSIVMVFVADVDANATFNNPAPGPTNCPVCYDPVRRQKFWGAVGCTVDWRGLRDTARWERYADMGYHYRLTRFSTFINETILLAGSEQVPGDSLYFSVPVAPDISWTLAMGRVGGWVPPWRNPLLGVVVAVSLLVPALLFLLIIKQRQHTSLLHSIVPKQAVRYLACGRKYARSFNNVTVLFSDIVRYTELSSGLTALQVVELLDEVYAAFDLLCEAHGIYRCDVIGDAYMAVAGIPESEPPHQAAVRAARMAQAMIQVTRRMVTKSGIQIQIRVGCHSGPLVAAVLGSHSSPKYTVLGDTVNTASRMESSSEPMCIQVSAVTAQLLGEAGVPLELRPRGDINIKGKGVMATSWLDPEVGSSLPRPAATAPTAGSSSGGAATAPVAHRRSGSMKRLSVLLSGAAPQHPAISAPCHTVLEVESAPNNVGGSAATLGVRGGSDSDSGGGGGMVAGADDDDDAAAAKSGAVAGVERLMFVGDLDHSIPSIRPVKPEEWA